MNIIFLGIGMNWTRTSYLFLVMILISVGVTSAYAITITLGADPVNVKGTLVVDGDLDLRGTSTTDDDIIFFDEIGEGSEHLQWDNSQFRFEFTRGLAVDGTIQTGNSIFSSSVAYNRMGTTTGLAASGLSFNADDLLVSGNIEVGNDIYVLGSSGTDDDTIFFDQFEGPSFGWDDSETQFEFFNNMATSGVIQMGNAGPNVAFNRLGTATPSLAGIDANNDLLISGSLEVIGTSQFQGDLTMPSGNFAVQEGTFTASGGAILNTGVNFGTPNLRTISPAGAVTPGQAYHTIAANTATADDLDTISGGIAGDFIIIRADTGDTITVTSAGNIRTDGSLILDNNDHAGFIFDGASWNELFRSNLV